MPWALSSMVRRQHRVYIDSRENPQIGLIWYKNRVYLAGAPAADGAVAAVRQLLVDEVCPQARTAGEALLLLYVAPDEWAQQIDAILPDQRPVRVERQYYEFRHATLEWRTQLPADFTLCLADAALLAQEHLQNREALMEEMCSERASVADFLAQSFGVCLLHGDEIAGWCLSEYNSPTGCEVGIATGEPYRRRGLATVMAAALVELAQARGMAHVGWDCFAQNRASGATARKAGFELVREYASCLVWFDGRRSR